MTTYWNIRHDPRFPLVAPIQVSWEDRRGIRQYDQGSSLDISEGGLRMELPDPIDVRTCVNFQVLQPNLVGSASVRHCTSIGLTHVIGVELSSKVFLTVRDPRRSGGDHSAKCQSAGGQLTIDDPPEDELQVFFQDATARRKARERARWKSRLKFRRRVMLAVWVAVVVLFLFSQPKFIRTVREVYPNRIVQLVTAVAGVEANHGQEDVKEQELAGTKPPGERSSQSLAD